MIKNNQAGLTLVELIASLVILSLILLSAIPKLLLIVFNIIQSRKIN
ncbi:prepilin-type N-terminal cleavage/methylation domain-containing protein [Neobacillus sp. Marseille-QA0830]